MAKKISRRKFLGELSKFGLGAMAAPGILTAAGGLLSRNATAQSTPKASLVVQVTDPNATVGFTSINAPVVQTMMDYGIRAFTGINDVGEAWKTVFPGVTTSSVISIKINCIYSSLSTHPAVTTAMTNSLRQMNFGGIGFPENNLIIWDRTDGELTGAGYTINAGATGVRCLGTNHSGVGYDMAATAVVDGATVHFSKILSQMSNYLIDAPVVKDHSGSGMTASMKNFYGAIDNLGPLHNNYCDPAIAQLNNATLLRDKTKIVIVDALWGIYNGGPGSGWTYGAFSPNSLFFATDRVAVDYVIMKLIDAERATHGRAPVEPNSHYIQTANDLGIGTNNPANITIVVINTPSGLTDWDKFIYQNH